MDETTPAEDMLREAQLVLDRRRLVSCLLWIEEDWLSWPGICGVEI